MSQLAALRSRLAALRRHRQGVRWGAAAAGFLAAALWVLAGVFLVDWTFQRSLDLGQRIILDVLALLALVWAFRTYAWPWFGVREDETEMALLVERQHGISSDLVAALQFEKPEAAQWGSRQLEGAVIEKVAQGESKIDVFEGIRRDAFFRRLALLVVTALAVVGPALAYPEITRTFFERLVLRARHYPSATRIELALVNTLPVLSGEQGSTAPLEARCAELRPVEVTVLCRGELPAAGGKASLHGADSRQRYELELKPLSLDERRARLHKAQESISQGVAEGALEGASLWRGAAVAWAAPDAPEIAARVKNATTAADLAACQNDLASAAANLETTAAQTGLYVGQIDRLTESLAYKLFLGDAWTDRGDISKIPLPILAAHLQAEPPEYARHLKTSQPEQGDRYLAALEGSQIELRLESLNKSLREAWLTLRAERRSAAELAPAPLRLALTRADGEGRAWQLPAAGTPLAALGQNLAYEIQVVDSDGLSLVEPLAGRIVAKEDRGPGIHCHVPERIWLPAAAPKVGFSVRDDYGIAALRLHVKVDHANGRISSAERNLPLPAPAAASAAGQAFLPGEQLPYSGFVSIPLASLKLNELEGAAGASPLVLAKDDRVEVVLEAIDYRGNAKGKSSRSQPVFLPIGQQSDILTAVDRSLDTADQKATLTIDTQIGIGESP